MIKTRKSQVHDESWILEKLSKQPYSHSSFRPEDFLVAIDEETEERIGFGRLQYHRNVDNTEQTEINCFKILDRGTNEQGCLLLVALAKKAKENNINQLFALPVEHEDIFKEVGFKSLNESELPDIIVENKKEKEEKFNKSITPLFVIPKNINYEIEDESEINKDELDVTDEEISNIREELNIPEDTSTKYSI